MEKLGTHISLPWVCLNSKKTEGQELGRKAKQGLVMNNLNLSVFPSLGKYRKELATGSGLG